MRSPGKVFPTEDLSVCSIRTYTERISLKTKGLRTMAPLCPQLFLLCAIESFRVLPQFPPWTGRRGSSTVLRELR